MIFIRGYFYHYRAVTFLLLKPNDCIYFDVCVTVFYLNALGIPIGLEKV